MDQELKSALDGIMTTVQGFKTRIDEVDTQVKDVQRQTDTMNLELQRPRLGGGFSHKSVALELQEQDAFRKLTETGKGHISVKLADFQKKTAITNTALGSYTTGVVMGDRQAGIVPAAIRTFRMRELMRVISTEAGAIDFVKVTSYSQASPQVEASNKNEAAINMSSVSERIKTLAHWVPVTMQALQDIPTLEETINVHLLAGLYDEEDEQVLSGDGTSENLDGLTTQATAFDTSLLVASDGWEYADLLGRSIQQLETAKQRCTGIVLHPSEWWSIILQKDANGQYIYGSPTTMSVTQLWGRPVAVTTAIAQGTFLVGDFQTGCALFMRMDAVIEAGTIDQYFIQNKLALRCEERCALAVYKPGAFIQGSFSQSPL